MSSYHNGAGQHLDIPGISVPTDAGAVYVAFRAKIDSGQTQGSSNTAVSLANTAAFGSPSLNAQSNTALQFVASVNGAGPQTTAVPADEWHNVMFGCGTSWAATVPREYSVDGAAFGSSSGAAAASAAGMLFGRIGGRVDGTTRTFKGRLAEVGIWWGLTSGQRDTVNAEFQTTHVDLISITPQYSWRLHNSNILAPATGGITLTSNGATASTDEPAGLTGGGGGGGVAWANLISL